MISERTGLLPKEDDGVIFALACSPDNKQLLSASSGDWVYLWNLQTGERAKKILIGGATNITLAFTAENTPLATFSANHNIYLLNVNSGKDVTILGVSWDLTPIFSPDATFVGTVTQGNIGLCDTTTHEATWHGLQSVDSKTLLAISKSNTLFAVASDTLPRVQILDVSKEGSAPKELWLSLNNIVNLKFSPDDSILAVVTLNHGIALWYIKSRTLNYTTRLCAHWRQPLYFSSDSKHVSRTEGGDINIWDARTGKVTLQKTIANIVFTAVYFSRSDKLFVGDYDGNIHVHTWSADDFDPDVEFADIKSAAKTS